MFTLIHHLIVFTLKDDFVLFTLLITSSILRPTFVIMLSRYVNAATLSVQIYIFHSTIQTYYKNFCACFIFYFHIVATSSIPFPPAPRLDSPLLLIVQQRKESYYQIKIISIVPPSVCEARNLLPYTRTYTVYLYMFYVCMCV